MKLVNSHQLEGGAIVLECIASYPRPHTGAIGKHWWLRVDEKIIAYAKTDLWPDDNGEGFTLSSVEVREGHRGLGVLRPFLRGIETIEQEQLFSTGNWTALGEKALRFLPVAKGSIEGVFYPEQTFVKNWDECLPKYA